MALKNIKQDAITSSQQHQTSQTERGTSKVKFSQDQQAHGSSSKKGKIKSTKIDLS